jgi:hypothetical protein
MLTLFIKKKMMNKALAIMKKVDQFGKGLGFTFKGSASYGSLIGGIASVFYVLIVLAYAGLQFSVMASYGNTSFQTSTILNKYS